MLFALWGRPAQAQFYYLDLSQQTLSLPDRAVYVEQVVDGRPGKPAIGTVYRGLQNQQQAVIFRKGLEPTLTEYLQQQFPRRATDHAVVLCVRQLVVNEMMRAFAETASADVSADVYAHLPDGYHFVRTVASHIDERALETTGRHAHHLAGLLQQCLAQLADADWAKAAQRPARTLAQLPTEQLPAAAKPAILRTATPKAGPYKTFEQFLANQPEAIPLAFDTVRAHTAGWEGTVLIRPSVRNLNGGHTALPKAWGFSDGQQLYVRYRNHYRPLHRQGSFFTFVGPAPFDMAAANKRAWGYNVPRANGMGTRTPATGNTLPSTGAEDTSGLPMVFALDMHSGEPIPYPLPGQAQRADTAFMYVYRPLGGSPEALRVFMNDREAGQLRPGQYLELFSPHFAHAVRLSAGTASGPAFYFVPNTASANYLKLVPSGTALTPWQAMPTRQGEAEVDALEKPRK
ncbi:hypothetical protein GCM10028824_16120 [Hymenobacter segetis]|uniref:DUF4384 domain-containing protein n=1 Tax=Hymenobacter segetis TaxID=2025509 RepID=A0ABU9LQ42_9BACT